MAYVPKDTDDEKPKKVKAKRPKLTKAQKKELAKNIISQTFGAAGSIVIGKATQMVVLPNAALTMTALGRKRGWSDNTIKIAANATAYSIGAGVGLLVDNQISANTYEVLDSIDTIRTRQKIRKHNAEIELKMLEEARDQKRKEAQEARERVANAQKALKEGETV